MHPTCQTETELLLWSPKVLIPLQGGYCTRVNPVRLLRRDAAIQEKELFKVPVYLTSFYREGIEQKEPVCRSLTEGNIQDI